MTPAAESAAEWHHPGIGLGWLDWTVIALYLGSLLAMGWRHSRRQQDEGEYFIAANRPMNPILVGISVYAAIFSTISYLGKPGEMINKGPVFLLGQILSVPVTYYIVTYKLIPRIMEQRVTSGYELLEENLGLSVRLLGSALFLGLRLFWLGLLVYTISNSLAVILGVSGGGILAISIVCGVVTIGYTALGGLRSVVIADVIQVGLLLLGALLTIATITHRYGGRSWILTHWSPYWDRQPVFSFDPHVRVSVLGATISWLIIRVAAAGGDQTAIQRFMATKDRQSAQRSYGVDCLVTILVTVILGLLGLALLGFFSQHPLALPAGMTVKGDGDRLFPYFISHYLPTGFAGLAVVAVMAAAMESIAAGINSISAVVVSDFLERLAWAPKPERARVRLSRTLSIVVGTVVIGFSLAMKHVPGNFIEVAFKTVDLVAVPVFGLFFLAFFVPSATPVGAWLGTAYGLAGGSLIAFWDLLTGRDGIGFQWVSVGTLVGSLGVGWAASRWGPARGDPRTGALAWAGTLVLAAGTASAIWLGRSAHFRF